MYEQQYFVWKEDAIQFHQQNCTYKYKYKHTEQVKPNSIAARSTLNTSKISVVLQYHKSCLYNVGEIDPCSPLNLSNKCVRNQTRRKDKKEQRKTKQESDKNKNETEKEIMEQR